MQNSHPAVLLIDMDDDEHEDNIDYRLHYVQYRKPERPISWQTELTYATRVIRRLLDRFCSTDYGFLHPCGNPMHGSCRWWADSLKWRCYRGPDVYTTFSAFFSVHWDVETTKIPSAPVIPQQ